MMKAKNIVISIVLFIVVASLFGWRYWYVPNFIMPKSVPVTEKQKAEDGGQKTVIVAEEQTVTKKPDPAKKIQDPKPKTINYINLLKNSSFKSGQDNWQPWQKAKDSPENIKIVNVENNQNFDFALRIENPGAGLIGMQQLASLKSGTVYRLSGTVRSMRTHDDDIIFGGRIALFLPPQKEQQIVWMGEYDKWWEKELFFTNQVSGTAVIYIHMGYGGVSSTGEFTNIRLEKIGK